MQYNRLKQLISSKSLLYYVILPLLNIFRTIKLKTSRNTLHSSRHFNLQNQFMKKTFYSLFFLSFCLINGLLGQTSPAQNAVLRANLPYTNQTLANICGYTANGREYALLGGSLGLIIVDVTNPDQPRQIKQIPGANSLWKEIKVYRNYAYITTEGSGQGLQVVNLQNLPDTNLSYQNIRTVSDTVSLDRIHALHIDTLRGYLYAFGGNNAQSRGGALVLNLQPNPMTPTYAGVFSTTYVHDGYVDNDTLFAAHINAGFMQVIDFRDKRNPRILSRTTTPTAFTHNTWLSVNKKTVFTTDENGGSYLTAYDVTDPTAPRLLDKIQSVAGANAIIHNTHILNDYAVTSWYTEGIVIHDVHRPSNIIQVGQFDTYNGASGATFNGTWGVYPYLPSGTLVVSNINEGLFVISPTYRRACYLEGNVIDSVTRIALAGVSVKINSTDPDKKAVTNNVGNYASGQVTPGSVTVTYSKAGYYPKTITVSLVNGQVTLQNVELRPMNRYFVGGSVATLATNVRIPSAKVFFKGTNGLNFSATTDANGSFTVNNLIEGSYKVFIGAWGYLHDSTSVTISGSTNTLNYRLKMGYQDDFWEDFGWTIGGDIAAGVNKGRWERGVPILSDLNGAISTPSVDAANDMGDMCYVTGNGGGTAGANDVDDGATLLVSPTMKLRNYGNPILKYQYFFYNGGGTGTPNDSLVVILSNGLRDTMIAFHKTNMGAWTNSSVLSLKRYLPLTDSMRVTFRASDGLPGHVLETLVDNFVIYEGVNTQDLAVNAALEVYPNPSDNPFFVKIKTENLLKNAVLRVYDLAGKLVEAKNIGDTEGGLFSIGESLTTGVYILRLESETGKSETVRLVKL